MNWEHELAGIVGTILVVVFVLVLLFFSWGCRATPQEQARTMSQMTVERAIHERMIEEILKSSAMNNNTVK